MKITCNENFTLKNQPLIKYSKLKTKKDNLKNEDDLENEDDLKKEDNFKKEDNLKNM